MCPSFEERRGGYGGSDSHSTGPQSASLEDIRDDRLTLAYRTNALKWRRHLDSPQSPATKMMVPLSLLLLSYRRVNHTCIFTPKESCRHYFAPTEAPYTHFQESHVCKRCTLQEKQQARHFIARP